MEKIIMENKRMELDLPAELYEQLQLVAGALGISSPAEAAVIAIGDWVARRKAEAEDRDPSQRYFVNQALDELEAKKRH